MSRVCRIESSPTPAQALLSPEDEHLRGEFIKGDSSVINIPEQVRNMRESEFNKKPLLKRTLRLRC
jgi:hypothetical protein